MWESAWEKAYLSPNPCAHITVAVCFFRAGTTRGAAVAMFKVVYLKGPTVHCDTGDTLCSVYVSIIHGV